MTDQKLLKAATNAAATLAALYDWLDKVDAAGGTTTLSGVAKAHAMLASMRKNRPRLVAHVMKPLKEALDEANKT